MEKIKIKVEPSNPLEALQQCIDKINEIVDELQTINVQKVTIDRLIEEDRLKTLEDKVKFIMEFGRGYKPVIIGEGCSASSSHEIVKFQDLWDEENKMTEFEFHPPVEVKTGVEYEVKTCINCKEPTVKECDSMPVVISYGKEEKIEEIISEFNDLFPFYHRLTRDDWFKIESWLRDKLKHF